MTRISRPQPSAVDTALAAEFARILATLEGSGAPAEILALARQLDAAIHRANREPTAPVETPDAPRPR